MNKKTYLHSTLIKYKDLLKPKHFLKCNNIYIPLWLNIKWNSTSPNPAIFIDLHSTLIKYKATSHSTKVNNFWNIYIPLWLNIKLEYVANLKKGFTFTFHSD